MPCKTILQTATTLSLLSLLAMTITTIITTPIIPIIIIISYTAHHPPARSASYSSSDTQTSTAPT